MDTFKDFFSDLKERISNPFISSFAIAWLIYNYPILITLLFYKQTELKADGYTSYLNLIQNCTDTNRMLYYPLGIAFLYTFAVPFFKSGIRIFNSWLLTSTDGIVYKMTKNKVVSIELHTKVSKDLEEVKSQYVTLITSESAYINEIDQLKARIHTITETNTETIGKLNSDHDKVVQDLIVENNKRMQTATDISSNALNEQALELSTMKNQLHASLLKESDTLKLLNIQEDVNLSLVNQNNSTAERCQQLASELLLANENVSHFKKERDQALKQIREEKTQIQAVKAENLTKALEVSKSIESIIERLKELPKIHLASGQTVVSATDNSDTINSLENVQSIIHTFH
ncbi:MAG: hypothetical protein EOO43_00160 [Flavobacterium sp.]|nr:MAG: hypothetical protein EOO43_00160 [Flavobacterium sp.]